MLGARQDIEYGNGMYVIVGYQGNSGRIYTSPDGISWTTRTTPNDGLLRGITYTETVPS